MASSDGNESASQQVGQSELGIMASLKGAMTALELLYLSAPTHEEEGAIKHHLKKRDRARDRVLDLAREVINDRTFTTNAYMKAVEYRECANNL